MIGPFLHLSRTLLEENCLNNKCNIQMHEYNAQALLIVVEHIYGMDVTGVLEEASLMCLADVFRLGATWDLLALVDLTAQILGLRAGRQETAALRSILIVIRSMLPQSPEAIHWPV